MDVSELRFDVSRSRSDVLKFAYKFAEEAMLRELPVWKHFSANVQPIWYRENIIGVWAYTVEPFQKNLPVFSKISQDYFKPYSNTFATKRPLVDSESCRARGFS